MDHGVTIRQRRWRTLAWFHWLLLIAALSAIVIGSSLAWGQPGLPAGLVLVAAVRYLMEWRDTRASH